MTKLRRVLRAIRKHFPLPPDNVMAGNAIDKFLDNSEICEDKLSEVAGSKGFLDTMMKIMFSQNESFNQQNSSMERYSLEGIIQLLIFMTCNYMCNLCSLFAALTRTRKFIVICITFLDSLRK